MAKEIAILSYTGIPGDALLSVRAGTVRRQATVNSGKPYKFPKIGIAESPVKIDVYRPIGTAYLVMKPGEDRYNANFTGKLADGMSCEFEVRASGPEDPLEKEREAQQNARTVAKESEDAQEYLQRHSILDFVQAVLQTVIKERPEDPYAHMARYFTCGYEAKQEVRAPTSLAHAPVTFDACPKVRKAAERMEARRVADEIFTRSEEKGASPVMGPAAAPDLDAACAGMLPPAALPEADLNLPPAILAPQAAHDPAADEPAAPAPAAHAGAKPALAKDGGATPASNVESAPQAATGTAATKDALCKEPVAPARLPSCATGRESAPA